MYVCTCCTLCTCPCPVRAIHIELRRNKRLFNDVCTPLFVHVWCFLPPCTTLLVVVLAPGNVRGLSGVRPLVQTNRGGDRGHPVGIRGGYRGFRSHGVSFSVFLPAMCMFCLSESCRARGLVLSLPCGGPPAMRVGRRRGWYFWPKQKQKG